MGPGDFGVFIPFGAFLMVIIIVWVSSHEKQVKARYRSEVQRELIAKFGSGRELSEFLNSEGSRQLLGNIAMSRDPQNDFRQRTLGMITGGLIVSSIGSAFLYFGWRHQLILVGMILLGVGLSLLISAAISYYLSKKWGLDKPGTDLAPRT